MGAGCRRQSQIARKVRAYSRVVREAGESKGW